MAAPTKPRPQQTELALALSSLAPFFKRAALFSVFTNVLSLGPALYMLQVYGRVVDSGSLNTLLMLTVLVLGLYVFMEALEWVRGTMMHNAGIKLDTELCERVFNAIFEANLLKSGSTSSQALNDLRTVRDFLSSHALLALMDVPFSLLFLFMIFMIHPVLGVFALVGAVAQSALSLLNERKMRRPLTAAIKSASAAQYYARSSLRNAQVIEAMGMVGHIERRWMEKQREFLLMQAVASDSAGSNAAASKFILLSQTSMVLGLSSWLHLKGQMAGGGSMIIVASILGGKVIAPLVQAFAQWRTVVGAGNAYLRLDHLLQSVPARQAGMALPPPAGKLRVEVVRAGAPGSQAPILHDVVFFLPAGDSMAIIGPSASGKSTLARLMVGVWPVAAGKGRLDGADVYAWNKGELGPHIGYLPQDIELLDGTLAENIARFGEIDMASVEEAAHMVGLHETIMALPDGYESSVGEDGGFLSGGQRQRVALARAIYGKPSFIVLDEPNSGLDEAGERDLVETLRELKSRGATVVVITHRPMLLSVVDRILVLHNGTLKDYGPREKIRAKLFGKEARADAKPQEKEAPRLLPAAATQE